MANQVENSGLNDKPERLRQVVPALSLALLAFFTIVLSLGIEFLGRGIESLLLYPIFGFLTVGCSIVFAVASRRSWLTKSVVIVLGLAAPLIAIAITPFTLPITHVVEEAVYRSGEKRDVRHLAFLQERFAEPQAVVAPLYPYVITEGGFSLKLYGPSIPVPNRDAAKEFFETTLEGKKVTAKFPPDFLDKYMAGGRRGTTYPYRAGESARFGDARALIYVEGELINLEIVRRWGSERQLKIWTGKYDLVP